MSRPERPLEPNLRLFVRSHSGHGPPDSVDLPSQRAAVWAAHQTDDLDALAIWSVPRDQEPTVDQDGRHNGQFYDWLQAPGENTHKTSR